MRYPCACISEDPMGCLPFTSAGEEDASGEYRPLLDPVPRDQFYDWWYRVKVWRLEITIAFDPDTVADGAPATYTYSLFLTRQLGIDSAEQERALLRPGAQDEAASGPLPGRGVFTGALDIPLPGDDYFSSVSWSATLAICPLDAPGGYTADGDAGKPASRYEIVGDTFEPTITLVIQGTFDDGSEGAFSIQCHDPFLAAVPPEDDVASTAGVMDGIDLGAYAINFAPTYAWDGSPPTISLTPYGWYEFRRSDGTEPIFSESTGEVIPGQTPFTNVL